MEQWKWVKEFPSYQVSTYGRIKSWHKQHPVILQQLIRKDAVCVVTLCNSKRRKTVAIHRIVASTFLKHQPGQNEVNHKDCNRLNNHADNLEWVTRRANAIHAKLNRRYSHGSNRWSAKLTEQKVQEIVRLLRGGLKRKVIAQRFKVHPQRIQDIRQGHDWVHVTGGRVQLPVLRCPFCHYQWTPSFKSETAIIKDCQRCGRLLPITVFASPHLKFPSQSL